MFCCVECSCSGWTKTAAQNFESNGANDGGDASTATSGGADDNDSTDDILDSTGSAVHAEETTSQI